MYGGVQFVVEHDLGHAGAVAQVDEDDLAEIAAAVDPSHEHNFFARIGEPKSSAHMSSSEVA
jgi:O-acetylhomoserine/O-acetylserine sulfhydrylase-like pyridoxal-dependent enzyme